MLCCHAAQRSSPNCRCLRTLRRARRAAVMLNQYICARARLKIRTVAARVVKPVRRACARGWIFGQNAQRERAKCSLAGLTTARATGLCRLNKRLQSGAARARRALVRVSDHKKRMRVARSCLMLRPKAPLRGPFCLALTRALRARRARPPEVAALQPRAQRA